MFWWFGKESLDAPPPLVFHKNDKAIFVKNVADLLPEASAWLDDVAAQIRGEFEQNPDKTLTITGYSAIFPGLPDPVELSQERAGKIKDELVKRGIPIDKIITVAGGETSKFGVSREENRRIEIVME